MTSIETITSSIRSTIKSVEQHIDYPSTPGLYAFQLAKDAELKGFGVGNQIIYIGKAEDSLKQRDLNTHFKDNRTGSSTLRCSIGAILKADLKTIAFSRNGTLNPPNIDNYKFDSRAEIKLSQWMKAKLLIGYWKYDAVVEKMPLAEIEEQLIIALKPTLDLDRKTCKYNFLAPKLSALREACKKEARENVTSQIPYH